METETPRALWKTLRPSDQAWMTAGTWYGALIGTFFGIEVTMLLMQVMHREISLWTPWMVVVPLLLIGGSSRLALHYMRKARQLDLEERTAGGPREGSG